MCKAAQVPAREGVPEPWNADERGELSRGSNFGFVKLVVL